ncbi:MAG: TadE/TadG family type IV pilus assembly protein [Pseudomonadota bacterium]
MGRSIRTAARRFALAERGSIAFEFVITAPLLILLFFGAFAAFEAFRTYSQVAKVAYTLSDVSARYASVNDTVLEQIFNIHKRLLPGRVSDGFVRVSSICFNGDSNRVVWSYIGDDTFDAAVEFEDDDLVPRILPMTDADIPAGIMPVMSDNDSIILTEIYASWTPISPVGRLDPLTFAHTLVARPRFVGMVPYTGGVAGYPDAEASLCPEDVVEVIEEGVDDDAGVEGEGEGSPGDEELAVIDN